MDKMEVSNEDFETFEEYQKHLNPDYFFQVEKHVINKYISKKMVLETLKMAAKNASRGFDKMLIYYTGHGKFNDDNNGGNWCIGNTE